jgi:Ca-activated chloride channel family protein
MTLLSRALSNNRPPSRAAAKLALALVLLPVAGWADAGVLVPSNSPQPDPKILSLEEMKVDVRIDNGVARVAIRQIFASHHGSVLEGNWVFALPNRATISDFAVWDGVTRIPGVILERRRAEELYENLKWQSIDPGLLQMGEYDASEARRSAVFSAKVVPIPAYGTKRVEVEYHERIPVENLRSRFAIPLRPDAYQAQTAGQIEINVELRSRHAIRDFRVVGDTFPLTVVERGPNQIQARFEGRDVLFVEDFAVEYALDASAGDSLEVLTYRDPNPARPDPTVLSPEPGGPRVGFFQASALLALPPVEVEQPAGAGPPVLRDTSPPRTVVALFDNSLSMQWEKLERSYRALETLLLGLRPEDRFSLLLVNNEVEPFRPAPAAADAQTVEQALAFVKQSYIRGGTNLERALTVALEHCAKGTGERYLVLLSDGGATRGTIHNARLAERYAARLSQLDTQSAPRAFVFAVGDDANLPLLRMLARDGRTAADNAPDDAAAGPGGVLEWVRSTEPIDFKLSAFLSKIGRSPLTGLALAASPAENFDMVYPLEENWFSGSMASWVGRYLNPLTEARFTVSGMRGQQPLRMEQTATLPAEDLSHPHLPRTWARARVDALLDKIERDGEDQTTIDEIIRLAKQYKFVTPYTSFLAAPRSLLRPRVIRPGDPILRVRTDESIVSVTALFPFGLVKKLKFLGSEDIWQTRFLAPKDMTDGQHNVRLVLRDRQGRVYRESKSFWISSKPPEVKVKLDKRAFRRGETVELKASASSTTRTLTARMYGAPPVALRWNEKAGYNTGRLVIPADLPPGRYSLKLTAEDFAHNIGAEEVFLEVAP